MHPKCIKIISSYCNKQEGKIGPNFDHWPSTLKQEYIQKIEQKYSIKSREDWYNKPIKVFKEITNQDFKIGDSPKSLLSLLYPDHEWLPWKFATSFWSDTTSQRAFLEQVSKELKVTKIEDWYKITKKVTRKFFEFFNKIF